MINLLLCGNKKVFDGALTQYPYDENFMAVSKYAMKNTLSRCIKSTTVI